MRAQASIEFMLIASAVAALSLGVISLYGKSVLLQSRSLVGMLNYSQPEQFFGNYSSGAYVAPQQAVYSAVISNSSETLSYPLGAPSGIANLTEMVRCTAFSFFGSVLDVHGQCGTYGAWDYRAQDGRCPTSTTYCLFEVNTTYLLMSVESGRNYVYDFTLQISSRSGTMISDVSSGGGDAPLLLGNETVGYVKVVGVSSPDPVQSGILVGNGTSYGIADQQAYSQYLQSMGDAYSELSYYNSSYVDYDAQASLEQAESEFIAASRSLRQGSSDAPCRVESGNYTCAAENPFSFMIEVNLTDFPASYNQTLYYLGSAIELRGA